MTTPFEDNFYPMLKALGFGEDEVPSAFDIKKRIELVELDRSVTPDEISYWKSLYDKYHKSIDKGDDFKKATVELSLRMTGPHDAFKDVFSVEPDADLNHKLQKRLNKLTLSSPSRPRFFVAGSPQSEICIMADRVLLMRMRFGSLFIGGGAAIELYMEKLGSFLKPVDVSIIGMEVLDLFIKNKSTVKLTAQSSLENRQDYYDHLKTMAKKMDIEFEANEDKDMTEDMAELSNNSPRL